MATLVNKEQKKNPSKTRPSSESETYRRKIEAFLKDLLEVKTKAATESIKWFSGRVDRLANSTVDIDEDYLTEEQKEFITETLYQIIDILFARSLSKWDYETILDDILLQLEGIAENMALPELELNQYRELTATDYNVKPLDYYGNPSMYTRDEYLLSVGHLMNSPQNIREAERSKDRQYMLNLLQDAAKRNYMPVSQADQAFQELVIYNCSNPVDYITQEDITEKEFTKPGWIYLEHEGQTKEGTCYEKASLLSFLNSQVIFGEYPNRDVKYFKLPYPPVYIDREGLELIPTSKAVKLVRTGTSKLGTYFGISTTHGVSFPVYTLVKLR